MNISASKRDHLPPTDKRRGTYVQRRVQCEAQSFGRHECSKKGHHLDSVVKYPSILRPSRLASYTHTFVLPTVDDHGEMRIDAQNWAAAAIESKSDEKEISRAIKVCTVSTTEVSQSSLTTAVDASGSG